MQAVNGRGYTPSTTMAGIRSRIEENQTIIDELKTYQGFRNLIIVSRRYCCEDSLLSFITGKISLEDDSIQWLSYLIKGSECLQIKKGWFGNPDATYLSERIVTALSAIGQFGLMESREKSMKKLDILMDSIVEKNEKECLRGAHMQGANLQRADLEAAYLQRANLNCAKLRGANLGRANLEGANLEGANLEGADLRGATLEGANLKDAKLQGAKSDDPAIQAIIAEQKKQEKYSLLLAGQSDPGSIFNRENFPRELVNCIAESL